MHFSTIFTALVFPYIAHEQTAQNLDFVSSLVTRRSSLFALILIERHCSQNKGLLKSEERLNDFKEQCAQLCCVLYDPFFRRLTATSCPDPGGCGSGGYM